MSSWLTDARNLTNPNTVSTFEYNVEFHTGMGTVVRNLGEDPEILKGVPGHYFYFKLNGIFNKGCSSKTYKGPGTAF